MMLKLTVLQSVLGRAMQCPTDEIPFDSRPSELARKITNGKRSLDSQSSRKGGTTCLPSVVFLMIAPYLCTPRSRWTRIARPETRMHINFNITK